MHFVAAPPDQVLETMDDLKRALADPSFVCDVRRKVKSLWLCNLIREIEASGKYPYNNMVYRFAEDQLGLPPTHYDGEDKRDILRWLVYWNQDFRGHDDLVRLGFSPLTQEMIDQAFQQKGKIELYSEGMILSGTALYNVHKINNVVYAMKPRSRKFAVRIAGQPARIVGTKRIVSKKQVLQFLGESNLVIEVQIPEEFAYLADALAAFRRGYWSGLDAQSVFCLPHYDAGFVEYARIDFSGKFLVGGWHPIQQKARAVQAARNALEKTAEESKAKGFLFIEALEQGPQP